MTANIIVLIVLIIGGLLLISAICLLTTFYIVRAIKLKKIENDETEEDGDEYE